MVIGDRGFGRAGLIEWLQARGVDDVLRLKRGSLITEPSGRAWKLGAEGLRPGQTRWVSGVRYGTDHDRPRDLVIQLASSWRPPRHRRAKKGKEYQEPWSLATRLGNLGAAVAWSRQRLWLEETFRDFQSGFGLDAAQVASARRLGRLVAALSLALAWLHVLAPPRTRLLPRGWAASVVTHGHASRVSLALALLDYLLVCSPDALPWPASRPDPLAQAA